MELNFSKTEKLVGAFVTGVIIMVLATVVVIGRGKDWFEDRVTFYTTFNESYNLQSNAAVKLFKADIGKVSKISLLENKVRVKLEILDKYASRIRYDSVAIVDSPTFIGSEHISILPGKPDSPRIPEGGEITSREKKSVSDLLKEFEVERTARIIIQTVQELSNLIQSLNSPDGPFVSALNNVNAITGHMASITDDIQAGKGVIGELVTSRSLITGIEENLDKITRILSHIDDASAKTPRIMDQVSTGLDAAQQVGEQGVKSLADVRVILNDVRISVATLNKILANAEQGSRDVPEITDTARQGIKEIRDGVENIDKVVQSLQKNVIIRSNLPPEPVEDDTSAGLRK